MKKYLFTLLFVTCLSVFSQTKGGVRLSAELGLGYRTAGIVGGIPSEYEDHIRTLKSGTNINFQASYLFGEQWGLGLVYDQMSASSSTRFSESIEIEGEDINAISESVDITFIAPEFLYHSLSSNEKHRFMMSLAIGYLRWYNDASINFFPVITKGGTVGFKSGFSYDYHITKNIALGASINFIAGSLSKVTVETIGFKTDVELSDGDRENLSRITFNGGIRFYL